MALVRMLARLVTSKTPPGRTVVVTTSTLSVVIIREKSLMGRASVVRVIPICAVKLVLISAKLT